MWVLYSLFFAIWSSLNLLIVKKLTQGKIETIVILYTTLIFQMLLIFLLLFFVGGIPKTTTNFYIYMGASGLLDAIAAVISFIAIERSPISLISPMGSFGPVFTTIIAVFALHEVPAPIKFFGILLVVVGAYLLNVGTIRRGFMEPFRKLFSDKGVLLFLLANLLWSITPIFQKKAIFETSPQIPLFASLMGFVFGFVLLTPFAFKKTVKSIKELKPHLKLFIVNGVGTAFSQAAAYAAFALVFVGYATSVFRLSSLFTIFLGAIFLKEKDISEKLLGASVMVIGAILLVL
jgi:drug/metabolite transporter (DMT)-like permease